MLDWSSWLRLRALVVGRSPDRPTHPNGKTATQHSVRPRHNTAIPRIGKGHFGGLYLLRASLAFLAFSSTSAMLTGLPP